MPASASTITGWNLGNVGVDTRINSTAPDGTCAAGDLSCLAWGETGSSEVYDRTPAFDASGNVTNGAVTNGKIVFTAPEAFTPGIEVRNEPYTSSGPAATQRDLAGCIKSSSEATCTDGFQSGKRIKQQMTGTDPVDLVFDVDLAAGIGQDNVYQVFGRLINKTGFSLEGFKLELGYGIGDNFIAADPGQGLTFGTPAQFVSPPERVASVGTQFPFGLFGDADDNQNFEIDGFFDVTRTGLEVFSDETMITSMVGGTSSYYGNYQDIPGGYGVFGKWRDQASVESGLFWDYDGDPLTDALLIAWEVSDGVWELRRNPVARCNTGPTCYGESLAAADYVTGSEAELRAYLSDPANGFVAYDDAQLASGPIEDLANLNLNYAIVLGDLFGSNLGSFFDRDNPTFTLRTTVFTVDSPATIPLPAGAPMLLAGLAAIGLLRRRRRA